MYKRYNRALVEHIIVCLQETICLCMCKECDYYKNTSQAFLESVYLRARGYLTPEDKHDLMFEEHTCSVLEHAKCTLCMNAMKKLDVLFMHSWTD